MNSFGTFVGEILDHPEAGDPDPLDLESCAPDEAMMRVWDELSDDFKTKWEERWGPAPWCLDELPHRKWTDAMHTWRDDHTVTSLDSTFGQPFEHPLDIPWPPSVATRDGFQVPSRVIKGLLADLCGDNPWMDPRELGGDSLRVTEWMHPLSARRLHGWALRNAGAFPGNRVWEWESVFEAPELLLEEWEERSQGRAIQLLGWSQDRTAPLVAWEMRRQARRAGGNASVSAMVCEPTHSLDSWLESNFPWPVPPALRRVAQSWLESCAERGTSWSVPEWQAFRELDWFGVVAEDLLWRLISPEGAVRFVRLEGDSFVDIEDQFVTADSTDRIGVAHFADLRVEVCLAWARVFADYELVQPFDQLTAPATVGVETELSGGPVDVGLLDDRWEQELDDPRTNEDDRAAYLLELPRGGARIVLDTARDHVVEVEWICSDGMVTEAGDPVVRWLVGRDIERILR